MKYNSTSDFGKESCLLRDIVLKNTTKIKN